MFQLEVAHDLYILVPSDGALQVQLKFLVIGLLSLVEGGVQPVY